MQPLVLLSVLSGSSIPQDFEAGLVNRVLCVGKECPTYQSRPVQLEIQEIKCRDRIHSNLRQTPLTVVALPSGSDLVNHETFGVADDE